MNDLTIIYYTSNREDPEFEKLIQQKLLESAGDVPIISVSQKPIDLGFNICVGDIGLSDQNAHRQFQLGAKHATTKFVCTAEADFLYPPEYFRNIPEKDDVPYRADNLYILFRRGPFFPKHTSEGATVVGRAFIIDWIENELSGRGEWHRGIESHAERPMMFERNRYEQFHTENPIVTFKTAQGMHDKSPYSRAGKTNEVSYWGSADALRKEFNVCD